MELRQVEHFLAVVEERQFTRAARRSHLSQSALSASIRALENELHTKLFVRTSRGVDLTEAGRALRDNAPPILRAVALARDDVAASQQRLGGALNVAGIHTLGLCDQSQALAEFHDAHPEVEISYRTGISADLIPDVAAGRLDAAFVTVPPTEQHRVEVHPLASYPIVLACRSDHPLAAQKAIALAMLRDEPLIGGPPTTGRDAMYTYVARESGSTKPISIHANDNASARAFVEKGLGVALMPRELVQPPLVAVPLADTRMVWNIGVATAQADARPRAATVFLDIILSMVRGS